MQSFNEFLKTADNNTKPLVIVTTDGGPDENPRYPKIISRAIEHFKYHNLDALFLVTNAPGRSAFNRVERRMAPLSKQLSGVVIPHSQFGSHLNGSGKTIDTDLEKKNFEYARNLLADLWNDLIIDKHPVYAKYISPGDDIITDPQTPTHEWYIKHVQESQYC